MSYTIEKIVAWPNPRKLDKKYSVEIEQAAVSLLSPDILRQINGVYLQSMKTRIVTKAQQVLDAL